MEAKIIESENWDLIIKPKTGLFDLNLRDLWRYRYMISLFVRRDFVAFYKQTILGPLWYFLQPLFTSIVFTIIFGRIAKISTDGIPPFIFYLSGNITWVYFADCLNGTANTFITNARIFGKVYFPRLTVPISVVIINLLKYAIQLFLFICYYIYIVYSGSTVRPTMAVLLLPLIIGQMAMLGLGVGILVSSLTTKYRDLIFILGFGVQLWMFASPVVYPASIVPEKYLIFYMLNPMASILEITRFAFLGAGMVKLDLIFISWCVTLVILFAGVMLFSKIERTFMDTV